MTDTLTAESSWARATEHWAEMVAVSRPSHESTVVRSARRLADERSEAPRTAVAALAWARAASKGVPAGSTVAAQAHTAAAKSAWRVSSSGEACTLVLVLVLVLGLVLVLAVLKKMKNTSRIALCKITVALRKQSLMAVVPLVDCSSCKVSSRASSVFSR